MRTVALIAMLVLSGFMSGCLRYNAHYDVDFAMVDRQPGLQVVNKELLSVKSSQDKRVHTFEDDLVMVTWVFQSTHIKLQIHNKSSRVIRIPWDYAVYVDHNSVSHRVVHSGVRFLDDQIVQLPTPIAKGSHWSDSIYTADRIRYFRRTDGTEYSVDTILPFESEFSGPALKRAISEVEGKTVQILLPIESGDTRYEYLFSFKINKGSVYSASVHPRLKDLSGKMLSGHEPLPIRLRNFLEMQTESDELG